MRMISWNVNGLRAVLKKGFEDIVCQFDADVVALQETKLQAGQAVLDLPQYREFWSYAEKEGLFRYGGFHQGRAAASASWPGLSSFG